jgi:hypothetical protein
VASWTTDWLDRLLTAERIRRVCIATLAVNLALYALSVWRGRFPFDMLGTAVLPDLIGHLAGGKLAIGPHRTELYDIAAQHQIESGITNDPTYLNIYISPPLVALLYAPFACVPYGVAAVTWTAVSVGLLVLSAIQIGHLTPSLTRDARALLCLAAASSQPVVSLLGTGQDTAISLLLWSAGVSLALRKRDAASGLLFSLGLFKPQLFLLPPIVLFLLRRRRALGFWVAGVLAQAALTWCVFGSSIFPGWWRILHSPSYLAFLRTERAFRMASLPALVRSILPARYVDIADIVGGALSAGVLVWTVRRILPKSGCAAPPDERGAWAIACLATLIASPHLFVYDLALLAVPVALVLERNAALSASARRAIVALFVLTWTAGARAAFEHTRWPLTLLAASWTALPMLVLWSEVPTYTPKGPPPTRYSGAPG